MDLFKFLILCFVYKINAINIGQKEYKILKGRKALLNVTLTARVHSAIECATKCAKRNDCSHANFGNSQCEFLKYERPGVEIEFEDQPATKFIYAIECDASLCNNGGICRSNENGFRCKCPPGYLGATCEQECDGFLNNRCYKAYNEMMTWYEARDTCAAANGYLATVCGEETNNMLAELLTNHGLSIAWLGGNDLETGQWQWLTEECDFSEYQAWVPGEPSGGTTRCLFTVSWDGVTLEWNDVSCSLSANFICEFEYND